jgi:hypothetical protein
MAGVSSQGTYLSFAGGTYSVTSVQVDYGKERRFVGAGHMGLGPDGFEPIYRLHRTEDERATVEIEYIGGTIPVVNSTGTLTVSGRVAFSGPATCISSQARATLGDIVRGTASFRVA